MKARLLSFVFGFAIGWRLGMVTTYWWLRVRRRRQQAEVVRALRNLNFVYSRDGRGPRAPDFSQFLDRG